MKGTYRGYRFEIRATFTFGANAGGVFEVVNEVWNYRIQNPQGLLIYNSATADPIDTQPYANAAANAAIARINSVIAEGETAPQFDPPTGQI